MSVIGSSANQYEFRPARTRMTIAHSLSISFRISHWRENSRAGERIDLHQCCWRRAEVSFHASVEKDFYRGGIIYLPFHRAQTFSGGPFPENVYLAKRRYSSHLDRTRKFSATLLHCRASGQDTPRSRLETWMTQRRAACSLP